MGVETYIRANGMLELDSKGVTLAPWGPRAI